MKSQNRIINQGEILEIIEMKKSLIKDSNLLMQNKTLHKP